MFSGYFFALANALARVCMPDRNWRFIYRTDDAPIDATLRVAERHGPKFESVIVSDGHSR